MLYTFNVIVYSILVVSTLQSNLSTLNQDISHRILEYLPLKDEVHKYRILCNSCRDTSIQRDREVLNHVNRILHLLHQIQYHPKNSTEAIQEIQTLYDSMKFNQRFATYLPVIIHRVIQTDNDQLLCIFNICRKHDQDLFDNLNPINQILFLSSRAILIYESKLNNGIHPIYHSYHPVLIRGPKQFYKLIFDFTFKYLTNRRNNQTLQMDELIELGFILWDPYSKINTTHLSVDDYVCMTKSLTYDTFLGIVTNKHHSYTQQYKAFLDQLDLYVLVKWIKIADLDPTQRFKHALDHLRMDRYTIVDRVVNYLYEQEQYGVIRYLIQRLWICHPVIPHQQILNFKFHRFFWNTLKELQSHTFAYERKGETTAIWYRYDIASRIIDYLNRRVWRYLHQNGTNEDLQEMKQGLIDLEDFLGKEIYVSENQKIIICRLVINLSFIDFQNRRHNEPESIAFLKSLRYKEYVGPILHTITSYPEYNKFRKYVNQVLFLSQSVKVAR